MPPTNRYDGSSQKATGLLNLWGRVFPILGNHEIMLVIIVYLLRSEWGYMLSDHLVLDLTTHSRKTVFSWFFFKKN